MAIDRKQLRSSAQKQVRSGNWKGAIDKYETLVDDDPDDVRSRLKLADLYTRVGDEDRAIESYCEVGDRHSRKDLYQKAVAVYKQAIRLDPEDPELHRKVGEAYHRIDRLKDAAQSLRRAQKLHKKAGDREEQLDVLEELVRIDPDDVGLRIQLAETYAKQDRTDDALERFREAANMLEEEGRLDDYAQVAERIVFFDPDDVEVRKNAIQIYIDRDDHKRALKHLQVCFNNNPEDDETLRQLAETFMRLDRTNKAVLVFRKLAESYAKQGREDSARQTWTRILDIDPTNEKAQQALRKLGNKEETPEREPAQPERSEGREPAESAEMPTISDEEEPEADALDDVEFLDEEPSSGPQTPDPQRGVDPTGEMQAHDPQRGEQEQDHGFVDVPTEQLDETIEDRAPPEQEPERAELDETAPGGHDVPSSEDEAAATEVSESPERPANPTPVQSDDRSERGTAKSLGELSSETSGELEEMLDEADVFLKYELYEKARELIQKILRKAPELLEAYKKRRQLYVQLDEPQAEASTLIDMARLCDDRPQRARGYLLEASELGAPDRELRRAASEIGIELEELQQPVAAASQSQESSGLEEPTAGLDNPPSPSSSSSSEEPESFDSDEPMTLDPSEVEVIDEVDDEESNEVAGVDAQGRNERAGNETEFSEDEREAIEPVEDAGETDGGFGSAHETQPPEDPIDREESGLGTAEGLNFSSEELDGAIDGIFDGRDEDEPQQTDDGVLSEVDALIEAGDYARAEEALRSVERQYPDHPGIQSRRQKLRNAGGREFQREPTGSRSLSGEFRPDSLDEEESVAKEVEREETRRVDVGANHSSLELGLSYREMGMYDDAIEQFQEAIQNPDAAPAAKFHIAVCKAEKGNTEEAAEDLSRLLRYDQLPGELRDAAREKLDALQN